MEEKKRGRPQAKITGGKLMAEYYVDGNITKTCKRLGICRKTFYNIMDRNGMSFGKKEIKNNA